MRGVGNHPPISPRKNDEHVNKKYLARLSYVQPRHVDSVPRLPQSGMIPVVTARNRFECWCCMHSASFVEVEVKKLRQTLV